MYQIIFNPTAGKKKAVKGLETVCRLFKERNVAYQVHQTAEMHDAESIARRLTRAGASNLVVLGGDGTLHEVLNGIEDPTKCNLGLIPLGTGNDFAAALGIPLDAEKATRIILDGKATPVNYLQIGERRCMNVTGLGVDVAVLERCQRGKMKGKLKYLISLIQTVFTYKGIEVQVESDGVLEHRRVLIAAACNGDQFGGGIKICPTAKMDDGKISVVTVDCIGGIGKLLKAFMCLMKGKILNYPATKTFLCDRVRFLPDEPCVVNLDGELYSDLILDVQIGKGLKMYH